MYITRPPPFKRRDFEYVGKKPTVIDPSEIPRILNEGKYFMAVTGSGDTFYVTSDHLDFPYPDMLGQLPTCTDIIPKWYRDVPWEAMAKLRVLQLGDKILFLNYEINIIPERCWHLPELEAMILLGRARL